MDSINQNYYIRPGTDISQYADNDKIKNDVYIEFNNQSIKNLPKNSLTDVSNEAHEMLKEYNFKLIDKNYAIKRSELRKKDTIDLRNILTYQNKSYENKTIEEYALPDIRFHTLPSEFLVNNYWYCLIPCFNEGVMQLNEARYIYYKILNIDTIQNKLDIQIKDYLRMDNIWQISVHTTIHYDFNNPQFKQDMNVLFNLITNDDNHLANEIISRLFTDIIINHVTHDNDMNFAEIYRLIPYDEMHWSESQINIWENLIIHYAEDSKQKIRETGSTAEEALIKIFIYATLLSNQILSENKPKAVRNSNKTTSKRTIVTETNSKQPKKLVRTVGNIYMSSVKPPKLPTEETVIHYKTAVWKSRGGVRHMKNGKIVPFKESIKHRKCLQQTNDIPQSIIKFNKPIPKIQERKTESHDR